MNWRYWVWTIAALVAFLVTSYTQGWHWDTWSLSLVSFCIGVMGAIVGSKEGE